MNSRGVLVLAADEVLVILEDSLLSLLLDEDTSVLLVKALLLLQCCLRVFSENPESFVVAGKVRVAPYPPRQKTLDFRRRPEGNIGEGEGL